MGRFKRRVRPPGISFYYTTNPTIAAPPSQYVSENGTKDVAVMESSSVAVSLVSVSKAKLECTSCYDPECISISRLRVKAAA